jgi:hypothetical protein
VYNYQPIPARQNDSRPYLGLYNGAYYEVVFAPIRTTVRVNGVTIFDRVPQGELSFGDVGVVTHRAKGRFDNLSVTDAPRRQE